MGQKATKQSARQWWYVCRTAYPPSRANTSTEAFIVCRNFDPSTVPLPVEFSSEALADLERQTTGTLTLDSLACLGSAPIDSSPEWEAIKAYVGSGDIE